VTAVTFSTF